MKLITAASVVAGSLLAGVGVAATIFETTELVATTASADAQLPDAIDFEVSAAGTYVITLSDVHSPVLLGTLRAIVTRDLQIVAELEVTYPTGTPPLPDPVPATATFSASPGAYRIHVLGTARDGEAGGTFGVSVAAAGSAPIIEASDVILADPLPGDGRSVLQATFDIQSAGTYQLDLTDHAFPAPLVAMNALLLRRTATTPQIVLTTPGAFTATPGTYDLIVLATADAQLAGLYSSRVTSGATIVYQSANSVGAMPPATTVTLPIAGQYALTVADKEFPVALTSVAVAVTQNGAFLGNLTAAGSININAAQGEAQLFAMGNAVDVGAFSVLIAQGSQVTYADVHLADSSPDPATPAIYAVSPSQAVAAGSYRLTLKDFGFPRAFTSFNAAVVQGGDVIDHIDEAANLDMALQAGRVKVLVVALPNTLSGNGLFGLTLTSQPAGTEIFQSTQGVGGLFRAVTVQLPAAGRYDFTLADLGFPELLPDSALAITRGTELVGQIFGAGTLLAQQRNAGTYVLNFLGKPADNERFGSYGLEVADSPAAPTVTLSANRTTITAGETVTLQWSATNATTCSASNGWTGTKAVSGTEQTGALNANTTFQISCSGPGGSQSATATVTVNSPSRNGGGGGGVLDPFLLIYMCVAGGIGLTTRRSRCAA